MLIWTLLLVGFYPYLFYPVLVRILALAMRKIVHKDSKARSVTIVISAYNEADCIAETIDNKLNQIYPEEQLNIVVVSDGSTDATDQIVADIAATTNRVRLIAKKREGKTVALNLAVEEASADIIVFSDANSVYAPDAVQHLVANFSDKTVGYVTGQLSYGAEGDGTAQRGSSAYMRYENRIREWETQVSSIVGVDGGIDAVRRTAYRPMKAHELPDFSLPLYVVEQGLRCVYEPQATMQEMALTSARTEFRMRVRVATRALWTLIDHAAVLNVARFGAFSWQVLSHKWMRYLSFLPLLLAYILSIIGSFVLDPSSLLVASGGTVLLVIALVTVMFRRIEKHSAAARLVTYFFLINAASAVATLNVISGRRITTWQPRVGQ